MAPLPRNPKSVCVTQEPLWDVFYDGRLVGDVRAPTAYDAKRLAESDFDIDDVCLLRVVLRSSSASKAA